MKNATEWVTESPKTERQHHLRLSETCIERGGISTHHRGVLAEYLDTDIPAGRTILAHACGNDKCSNPRHLYWATDKENMIDEQITGKPANAWERTVAIHGIEEAKKIVTANLNPAAGGRARKGKTLSEEHKRKISEGLKKRAPVAEPGIRSGLKTHPSFEVAGSNPAGGTS